MPNPKRRHSKTRTAKRRTHDALKPTGLAECPHCHEWNTFVEERMTPATDTEAEIPAGLVR